ncbi:MAG: DUF4870 domain-containing protein [Anaerolineales bacterium]|nr:DUF4870 domain-containing protein [Anaerolineales bacterium]
MNANITPEERNWAAIAHASVLVSGLLGIITGGIASILVAIFPLAIYVAFRERSRYVAFQALQATALQLGGLIIYAVGLAVLIFITVVAWIVTGILSVVLIGVLLIPLALIITLVLVLYALLFPLIIMAYGLYGAVETGRGSDFRYIWIANWLGDSTLLP